MSGNLGVQAHMHELLEQSFEGAVIRDAMAAAWIPEGDGYLAALAEPTQAYLPFDITERLAIQTARSDVSGFHLEAICSYR